MKCQYCNTNLSLEDAFCPGCGRPNEQAQKHVEDMDRYKKEFESTREDVLKHTKKYTAATVRIVIAVILLVLGFIMLLLAANSYSFFRNATKKEAAKHYDEYSQELLSYLDCGDYQNFLSFMENKVMSTYDTPYEGSFSYLQTMANNYCRQQDILFRLIGARENSYSGDFDNFCESINTVYSYCENEEERYTKYNSNPEIFLKYSVKMKEDMEKELIVFFGLTQEEAASLGGMSKAKRTVFLEEKWEAIENNE